MGGLEGGQARRGRPVSGEGRESTAEKGIGWAKSREEQRIGGKGGEGKASRVPPVNLLTGHPLPYALQMGCASRLLCWPSLTSSVEMFFSDAVAPSVEAAVLIHRSRDRGKYA